MDVDVGFIYMNSTPSGMFERVCSMLSGIYDIAIPVPRANAEEFISHYLTEKGDIKEPWIIYHNINNLDVRYKVIDRFANLIEFIHISQLGFE